MATTNNEVQKVNGVITGVSINVFCGSDLINVVSNIQVSIRREVIPVYAMAGTPNPIAFAYQTRRITGIMEMIALDGYGAFHLVENQTTYQSMTEGLKVINAAGEEVLGDVDFDETSMRAEIGQSNANASQMSSNLISSAIESALNSGQLAGDSDGTIGSTGSKGIITYRKVKVSYIDQAQNLFVSFYALQEGTGKSYQRALSGINFHTHNIAIGMQVGATEEAHYFAAQFSKWLRQEDLDGADNDTLSYYYPNANDQTGSNAPQSVTVKDNTTPPNNNAGGGGAGGGTNP